MTRREQERIQRYLRKIRLDGALNMRQRLAMGRILRREMESQPWASTSAILKGLEK